MSESIYFCRWVTEKLTKKMRAVKELNQQSHTQQDETN